MKQKKILRSLIILLGIHISLAHIPIANADNQNIADIKKDYYKNILNSTTSTTSLKISACDSLITIAKEKKDTTLQIYTHIKKAEILSKIGMYTTSIIEDLKAINLINLNTPSDKEHNILKSRSLYRVARMNYNLGMFEQSTKVLYNIIADSSTNINTKVKTYALLSNLYLILGKHQYAEKYISHANILIEDNSKEIDTLTLFSYTNNLAALYYKQNKIDSVLSIMKINYLFANSIGDEYILTYQHNLSNIYLHLKELDLALATLLNIINTLEKTQNSNYLFVISVQNVAYIYFLKKEYKKSLKYYKKALALTQTNLTKRLEASCLIEMSSVYQELGEYKTALEHLQKGYNIKETIYSAQAIEKITIENNNFETKKNTIENKILSQDLNITKIKNKNRNIILLVLSIILLVFCFAFYYFIKKLKKQAKILNIKNYDIEETSSKLSNDINIRNRKLAKSSLILIQTNEILSTLETNVKKLKTLNSNSNCKDIINEMSSILSVYNPKKNWEEFSLYFEQISPNFFKYLTINHPTLSQNEQRTCALIYLNLTTKEIANITFRSNRTIESIMYQIRKKMNIPSEEKIISFLRKNISE